MKNMNGIHANIVLWLNIFVLSLSCKLFAAKKDSFSIQPRNVAIEISVVDCDTMYLVNLCFDPITTLKPVANKQLNDFLARMYLNKGMSMFLQKNVEISRSQAKIQKNNISTRATYIIKFSQDAIRHLDVKNVKKNNRTSECICFFNDSNQENSIDIKSSCFSDIAAIEKMIDEFVIHRAQQKNSNPKKEMNAHTNRNNDKAKAIFLQEISQLYLILDVLRKNIYEDVMLLSNEKELLLKEVLKLQKRLDVYAQ